MTDRTRADAIYQAILTSSATFTITPGTSGGSAFTITPPHKLRLMSAVGSNTSSGTECTSGNSPGYTAGGSSLGSSAYGVPSSGVQTNSNLVSWTATGTWTGGVAGVEDWDSAGTPLRWLQGPLTVAIAASVVVSGDTVSFAVASISADHSAC